MDARKTILEKIRSNKPVEVLLPESAAFSKPASLEEFITMLQAVGGAAERVSRQEDIPGRIQQLFPGAQRICSPLVQSTVAVSPDTKKNILEAVEVTVLQGEFGVAENGAVWLPEKNMMHRVLPFITQHLVLVLHASHIVANMHEAYQRLGDAGGYGVFIAGPSKTADIEQSLVIGAHGARSLTVILHD